MSEQTYQKVEGYNNLARDPNSGAIINTNKTAYDKAVARSNEAQQQRDEFRNAQREINSLKCEIHEIKSMLKQLVGNADGNNV